MGHGERSGGVHGDAWTGHCGPPHSDAMTANSGHVEPCVGQSADKHTEAGGFFPDAYNLTPLKGEKTDTLACHLGFGLRSGGRTLLNLSKAIAKSISGEPSRPQHSASSRKHIPRPRDCVRFSEPTVGPQCLSCLVLRYKAVRGIDGFRAHRENLAKGSLNLFGPERSLLPMKCSL